VLLSSAGGDQAAVAPAAAESARTTERARATGRAAGRAASGRALPTKGVTRSMLVAMNAIFVSCGRACRVLAGGARLVVRLFVLLSRQRYRRHLIATTPRGIRAAAVLLQGALTGAVMQGAA